MHIDSNDVFWMVRVRHDSLAVDFDDAKASLKVPDLQVFDDHDIANSLTFGLGLPGGLGFPYPAVPPVAPIRATVSFDVEWNGIVAAAQIDNAGQQFKGSFLSTGATISWSAEEPGFRFQSEPPDPARNLVSVLGHEQNGVFFS
ncbi:MAG TPA: hypothetical protein VJN48_10715 [Terriglobales bacterium]|nr:hypothetical protein [Terriglobales bacterium]